MLCVLVSILNETGNIRIRSYWDTFFRYSLHFLWHVKNNTALEQATFLVQNFQVLWLLLLLYDMDVSCHRPFLPGTSLEPAVIPAAQASSFTLQYFPYYV